MSGRSIRATILYCGLCTTGASLGYSGSAEAADLMNRAYWKAFASQGFVHTTDNQFYGETDDDVSTEFRELGLVAGTERFKGFSLAWQVLSRKAGDMSEAAPRLDYGYVDWMPFPETEQFLNLRAGRIRVPSGLYNEVRDIAHTRPGLIMPQSVYPDRIRDLAFTQDGVMFRAGRYIGLDMVELAVSWTRPQTRDEVLPELVARGTSIIGEINNDISPTVRLQYDRNAGELRLALSWANYGYNFSPAPGSFVPASRVKAEQWTLSGEYSLDAWTLTAEYIDTHVELELFLPQVVLPTIQDGYGGYVQLNRRFGPSWTTWLRYDLLYNNRDNRSDPTNFARDWSIGFKWQPDSNWLLGLEWHSVHGNAWLSNRENPDPAQLSERFQLSLFELAYLW